jgi:hypothetical protein
MFFELLPIYEYYCRQIMDRMDTEMMEMIAWRILLVCTVSIYRVIHKSVKHFKHSQQIDYATDHGNF